MEMKDVRRFAKRYKKGTYTNIAYTSELKLCAAAKKAGHVVSALTTKPVRFVEYENIASVKEGRADGSLGTRPAWEERVNDFVIQHKDTKKKYIRFANTDNHKAVKKYVIDGKPATLEEVKACGYVLPCVFNNNTSVPVIQCVSLDNVISLGGVC